MYLGYSREILAISGNTEQTWQADNFVFGLEGHIPVYQQFYFTLGGSLTIQQIENFTWNGGTGGENQTHELLGFKAGPSWQNERFFAQAVFIYRQAGKSNLYLGEPYFLGAGLSFGVFLF